MENKPWRLVDLSVVTQTRDAESKEESYHDVTEPATGYSNLVNPRLPKNTQDREIFQDRNLDAIWVKPFSLSLSLIYSNRAYYSTRILASSQRERERRRGWIDTLDTKSSRRLGKKSGGMEKGSGWNSKRVGFARKAKLVGGNLSRGAVRIHLNPLPPVSSEIPLSSHLPRKISSGRVKNV